jgi:peptide/nickel transport system ATP-binding protein
MLSGGQRQRVSFARSLVLKPLLIIADEPVSMLDVSIRIQILELMKKLKKEENVSFLYITHDLATSQYVGDNIIILYKGQIIEQGNIKQVLHHPLHPYTKALISAIPNFTNHDKEIKIKNDPEYASKVSNGCKFINKCLYSTEECKIKEPPLTKEDKSNVGNNCQNHFIRCFNYKVIS